MSATDAAYSDTKPAMTQSLKSYLVALVAVVLLFAACLLLLADEFLRPDAYQISNIRVKGEFKNLSAAVIEQTVADAIEGNFFSVDLEAIEDTVEAMPWVDNAALARRWPNTLKVNVREAKPIAQWQDDRWLTARGRVIKLPETVAVTGLPSFYGPIQSSKEIMERYRHWQPVFHSIGLELAQVHRLPRGGWRLQLNGETLAGADSSESADTEDSQPTAEAKSERFEISLDLGKHKADQRVVKFAQIYRQHLRNSPLVERVDMRYPNGFAVKWAEHALTAQNSRQSNNS